jgi:hypothetical protein
MNGTRRGLFLFNISSRKLKKKKLSYFKERREQYQNLKKEFLRLDMLLHENSIDESTYERLKKLVRMGYEQKRQETMLKHGFS